MVEQVAAYVNMSVSCMWLAGAPGHQSIATLQCRQPVSQSVMHHIPVQPGTAKKVEANDLWLHLGSAKVSVCVWQVVHQQ
jgi:hypothetical protein